MADTYYGVTVPGAKVAGSVLKQASTTSRNVELRTLDGVSGNNKTEILKALDAIRKAIENGPATA